MAEGLAIPEQKLGELEQKQADANKSFQQQTQPQPDEGFAALKSQRDALKEERNRYKEEATALRAYKAEQEAKAAEAKRLLEEKQFKEAGNYQAIIESNKKADTAKYEALQNRVAATLIPNLIKAASVAIPNLTKEAVDDLPDLLQKHLALDADKLTITVINPDGTARLDTNGKAVDPDQYIKDFVAARPYLLVDGMPKRHGLNGNKNPGEQIPIRQLNMNEFKNELDTNPEGVKEFMANEWTPDAITARAKSKLIRSAGGKIR